MMIGGTDPVRFAQQYAERIAYSHLKDVSVAAMERVKRGEISYFDSIVADELYTPLGQGDVDITAILRSMLAAGFDGWFVLEQDKVLHAEPAPGTGPIDDARASVEWLRGALAELEAEGIGA
jgi:inosose dehydratase